jgi:hypothetical protein
VQEIGTFPDSTLVPIKPLGILATTLISHRELHHRSGMSIHTTNIDGRNGALLAGNSNKDVEVTIAKSIRFIHSISKAGDRGRTRMVVGVEEIVTVGVVVGALEGAMSVEGVMVVEEGGEGGAAGLADEETFNLEGDQERSKMVAIEDNYDGTRLMSQEVHAWRR